MTDIRQLESTKVQKCRSAIGLVDRVALSIFRTHCIYHARTNIMATSKKFDFDAVWNQRLEDSGKISVVYINGIRTVEDKYKKDIRGFDGIWNFHGNLLAPAGQHQKDVLLKNFDSISKGAINLDLKYRNTSDSTGNDWADIGVFAIKFLVGDIIESIKSLPFDLAKNKVDQYKDLQKQIETLQNAGEDVTELKQDLDKLKNGADIGKIFDNFSKFLDVFEVIKSGWEIAEKFIKLDSPKDALKDPDFTAQIFDFIKNAIKLIPVYGEAIDTFIDRLIYAAPEDIKEALKQYWDNKPLFQSINDWTKDAQTWLSENSNNSLILLGHSQGNFFLEDGLIDMNAGGSNRIRVLALGSPTSYLYAGGIHSFKGNSVAENNIKNPGDPVPLLQFDSDPFFWDKIVKIFSMLPSIGGLGDSHLIENYQSRSDVQSYFKNTVYNLHSQGFYFPNSAIEAPGQASVAGTTDDDWMEGSETDDEMVGGDRNDVLRGGGSNDKLRGDSGYDFLDGGEGIDTADYSSSLSGIKVEATKFDQSDVYKVQDGFGTEDVLGNIEIISGSDFADEMTGGDYSDIFYGQGENDLFWGQKGDDTFYGGTG